MFGDVGSPFVGRRGSKLSSPKNTVAGVQLDRIPEGPNEPLNYKIFISFNPYNKSKKIDVSRKTSIGVIDYIFSLKYTFSKKKKTYAQSKL